MQEKIWAADVLALNCSSVQWAVLVGSRGSKRSSQSGQSLCYASDNNLASWAHGTSQTHHIEFVQAAFPQGPPLLTPWQWLMGNAHASASFSSGAKSHLKTSCRVENLPEWGSVVFRISCSSLDITTAQVLSWAGKGVQENMLECAVINFTWHVGITFILYELESSTSSHICSFPFPFFLPLYLTLLLSRVSF